jgi:hypothetical protein
LALGSAGVLTEIRDVALRRRPHAAAAGHT